MTTDFFNPATASKTELTNERARRSVQAFRAMQAGLTGYARAITGNKLVTVEVSKDSARTDGKRIYYKPPIELGDLKPHKRSLCDKRDPNTLMQRCDACRIRETVLIAIYHEIAHIAFETFAEPSNHQKIKAVERAIEEAGTKHSASIKAAWDQIPSFKKGDYLNLSSLISPFLPVLINALEDARVDENMFKVRRGTKVMFDAFTLNIFRNGVEMEDGTRMKWSERPLNSQAILGVFVLACRYQYEGWFSPEVEAAMGDKELRSLVSRVDTLRSAEGSYTLAFPILQRLRELGFCRGPEDAEDEVQEPEPEPEPEQEDPQDEEQQDDDETPDEEPAEEDDSNSAEDQPDPDEGGSDPESESAETADEGDPSDGDDAEGDEGDDGTSPDSGDAGGEPDAGDSEEDDTASDDSAGEGPAESADGGDAEDGEGEGESDAEPSNASDNGGDEAESDVPDQSDEAGGDEGSDGRAEGDEDSGGPDGPSDGPPDGDVPDGGEGSDVGGGESSGHGSPDGDAGEGGDVLGDEDPSDEPDEPSEELEQSERDPSGEADSSPERGGSEGEGDEGDLIGPEDQPDSTNLDELTNGDPSSLGGENLPREDRSDSRPVDHSPEASEDLDDGTADKGEGGTKVNKINHLDMGTPEEALEDVHVFGQHEMPELPKTIDEITEMEAIDRAILQSEYFEKPSTNINGVREHKYKSRDDSASAWIKDTYEEEYWKQRGIVTDLDIPESVLGPALLEMRRTFSDNQRSNMERHLRSGKINARVLGRRAWAGDDRLFQKKRIPGRKSYAVLLGIDASGSTMGQNIALAKRAAMAQAELCNRAGIDFAVYAHSANSDPGMGYARGLSLDIYEIKSFEAAWDATAKSALDDLGADCENLDGHTIEFYRKMIERHAATDKVILYYSDGKMPAANAEEELEILQREIAYCKRKGITLMGVGIRTDSPRRHGLNTVRVDSDSDVNEVVRHLESALLHRR